MIDMGSKSIRNLIIALVVLLIGIRAVIFIFNSYLSQFTVAGSLTGIVGAVEGMSTLLTYGILALIVIAIPFYLSKRSKEKESKRAIEKDYAEKPEGGE